MENKKMGMEEEIFLAPKEKIGSEEIRTKETSDTIDSENANNHKKVSE